MPELPEVETMRRGVLPVVGSRVRAAQAVRGRHKRLLIQPAIAAMNGRLRGQTVTSVDRVGKRVVMRFDSGEALVFEPRMTGLLLVADPPSEEHLRFRLDFANGPLRTIWYWDRRGLGSVRLLSPRAQTRELGPTKFGPDALAISVEEFASRFSRSTRAIKPALLDQKAVAGIGNLYASEMLHWAGIDPRLPCRRVTQPMWRRLHAGMLEILHNAILHEGSTLSDGTYRNALNKAGGYQNHHRVYDRAGDLCPTCGQANIVRIVQTQRATFYCPKCQKRS